MAKQFPSVVTEPVDGEDYLLTPADWSGDEYQSLYNIADEKQLYSAMAEAFQMEVSELGECETVTVYSENGIITLDHSDYSDAQEINDEGFLVQK